MPAFAASFAMMLSSTAIAVAGLTIISPTIARVGVHSIVLDSSVYLFGTVNPGRRALVPQLSQDADETPEQRAVCSISGLAFADCGVALLSRGAACNLTGLSQAAALCWWQCRGFLSARSCTALSSTGLDELMLAAI